jgi:hypothetical protein
LDWKELCLCLKFDEFLDKGGSCSEDDAWLLNIPLLVYKLIMLILSFK